MRIKAEKILAVFLGLFLVLFVVVAVNTGKSMADSVGAGMISADNMSSVVDSLPYQSLSEDEENYIEHMREEEKLARDVYETLYQKWNLDIFNNISQSEQRHMDAVKLLITKYDLPDPVEESGDQIGVFSDDELQTLYNQLVDNGSNSLVDALKVGATIEDLDIYDLENALKSTDNEDVAYVFNNIMQGSRNHLRAFVSTLEKYGSSYTPQYISEDEYESIIETPMEKTSIPPNSCVQFVKDPVNGKYARISVRNSKQVRTEMKNGVQAISDGDIDTSNMPTQINPDKVVDIQVTLPEDADNATITISNLIVPDNYVFYKYVKSTNSWIELNNCSECNFTETTNSDGTVNISFTITDGGMLDSDGVANGIITDPVVVASTVTSTTDTDVDSSSGGGGCTTNNSSYGFGLLFLFLTALAFSLKRKLAK